MRFVKASFSYFLFLMLDLLSILSYFMFFLTGKRTLFHYVSCEKPNGSDDGIYGGGGVSNAENDGEHG